MKQYRVRLSDRASGKLQGIYDYIAYELQAPPYAQAQISRLEDAIMKLDILPERCKIMEVEPWHSRHVRRLLADNYSIFYIVKKEEIIVIDILYSRSDIERRLAEG